MNVSSRSLIIGDLFHETNKLVKQDLLLTKPCWELLIRLCLCRCSIMLSLNIALYYIILHMEQNWRTNWLRSTPGWLEPVTCLVGQMVTVLLAKANVNSRSRSLYAIARPPVVCLSVVCNARAPYSGGSNFPQYFYGIRYLGHPLTSTKNFTGIVPGEPLRRGSWTQEG